jgi:hypothetical protein
MSKRLILLCPDCGSDLRIYKTRGPFRKRRCSDGHCHYTNDDTFITPAQYYAGETRYKELRNQSSSTRPIRLPKPRLQSEPSVVKEIPPIVVNSIGYYVEVTSLGRIYRMHLN